MNFTGEKVNLHGIIYIGMSPVAGLRKYDNMIYNSSFIEWLERKNDASCIIRSRKGSKFVFQLPIHIFYEYLHDELKLENVFIVDTACEHIKRLDIEKVIKRKPNSFLRDLLTSFDESEILLRKTNAERFQAISELQQRFLEFPIELRREFVLEDRINQYGFFDPDNFNSIREIASYKRNKEILDTFYSDHVKVRKLDEDIEALEEELQRKRNQKTDKENKILLAFSKFPRHIKEELSLVDVEYLNSPDYGYDMLNDRNRSSSQMLKVIHQMASYQQNKVELDNFYEKFRNLRNLTMDLNTLEGNIKGINDKVEGFLQNEYTEESREIVEYQRRVKQNYGRWHVIKEGDEMIR